VAIGCFDAGDTFLAEGFGGLAVDDIASRLQRSTLTLYANSLVLRVLQRQSSGTPLMIAAS
jgi:hypothetical protein